MRWIDHGSEKGYRQHHITPKVPFPEDYGEPPCGCRQAHREHPDAASHGMAACIVCGKNCHTHDDQLCGSCRKARRLSINHDPDDIDLNLTGGHWYNDHGIQRHTHARTDPDWFGNWTDSA